MPKESRLANNEPPVKLSPWQRLVSYFSKLIDTTRSQVHYFNPRKDLPHQNRPYHHKDKGILKRMTQEERELFSLSSRYTYPGGSNSSISFIYYLTVGNMRLASQFGIKKLDSTKRLGERENANVLPSISPALLISPVTSKSVSGKNNLHYSFGRFIKWLNNSLPDVKTEILLSPSKSEKVGAMFLALPRMALYLLHGVSSLIEVGIKYLASLYHFPDHGYYDYRFNLEAMPSAKGTLSYAWLKHKAKVYTAMWLISFPVLYPLTQIFNLVANTLEYTRHVIDAFVTIGIGALNLVGCLIKLCRLPFVADRKWAIQHLKASFKLAVDKIAYALYDGLKNIAKLAPIALAVTAAILTAGLSTLITPMFSGGINAFITGFFTVGILATVTKVAVSLFQRIGLAISHRLHLESGVSKADIATPSSANRLSSSLTPSTNQATPSSSHSTKMTISKLVSSKHEKKEMLNALLAPKSTVVEQVVEHVIEDVSQTTPKLDSTMAVEDEVSDNNLIKDVSGVELKR